MSSLETKYAADFRDHEVTRLENDRTLLPKIEAIRRGEDIESLERFAKAYLGMYLDIDNNIPPRERIVILANPELAKAIEQGFEAVLDHGQFPTEAEIADAMMDEQAHAIGYILLAALDLFSDQPRFVISALPDSTIRSALCLHYATKTELRNKWFDQILQTRQSQVAIALTAFWSQLIARDCDHLPGLYQIIHQQQFDAISREVVLPVLAQLHHCRKAVLRDLLQAAIRVCDRSELLQICTAALDTWNRADPARYMLWLSSAFLLQPEHYTQPLAEYCGFSKEKILPLLDFSVLVLQGDQARPLGLSASALATLLRVIAAKFTPQYDRYGNLCDNTQKVMYLFYRLAMTDEAQAAIHQLGQVRVMKLYKDILKRVAELHTQARTPSFDEFLEQLAATGSVRSRKKWSDLGH
ncbi:MAG: hypothetical protein P8Z75_06360 [Gammaproteobacteria bacterium]